MELVDSSDDKVLFHWIDQVTVDTVFDPSDRMCLTIQRVHRALDTNIFNTTLSLLGTIIWWIQLVKYVNNSITEVFSEHFSSSRQL